jgi:hypothetical protein
MNQYIITEEVAGIIETALESDEHCKKCPYEGWGFNQSALSLLRECPFQSERYCPWIEDDDGVYQTSCLHSFEFMNGNPELNGIKFCPYCGKLIRQSKDGEL